MSPAQNQKYRSSGDSGKLRIHNGLIVEHAAGREIAHELRHRASLIADPDRLAHLSRKLLPSHPDSGQLASQPQPVGAALTGVTPQLVRRHFVCFGQQLQGLMPYATTDLTVIRIAAYYYTAFRRASLLAIGNHVVPKFLADLFIRQNTGLEAKVEFTDYYHRTCAAKAWALHNLGPLSDLMCRQRGITEPLAAYLPKPYRIDPIANYQDITRAYQGSLLDGPSIIGILNASPESPVLRRRWFAAFDSDRTLGRAIFPWSTDFSAARQILADTRTTSLTPGEAVLKIREIRSLDACSLSPNRERECYREIAQEIFAPALCNIKRSHRIILIDKVLEYSGRSSINAQAIDSFDELFASSLREACGIPTKAYRSGDNHFSRKAHSTRMRHHV
jgi:hypothetical protein